MREILLDTPRGRLAALRHGPAGAPPVLALHGWLDNAASFLPLLPHLPDIDLVALDLPGHGHSYHRPPGAEYGLIDYLLDIDAAFDALGWARGRLLGHSLGGALATLYAAAAPERVERLALIEALGPLAGTPGGALSRLREALLQRRGPVGRSLRVFPDPAAAVRARMQANGLSEPAARLLVERGIAPVEGGFVWRSDPRLRLTSALRADEGTVREWLAGVECPVRLIAAAQSPPYFGAELRQARLACLRDGSAVVLPGGHHLHMETPAPVARELAAFLAG
ncbi:alpha/beta fold hydrolase [Rehaibacterium terrae]|jgi:pimeloyl-ACP methyl ester carboxylesterase|uniref:Pimeloyl-ACP methyl ester carboxylesterase n=1 Tax=Rehaibacterium terrae TaxID=1341696 RepID=A0A7W7V6I1_9GAMM|nr:alpha/beta hydrolase [Rehaibacterium terrae]MBB5014144.1 pimeloyl-ACP methyl ester carboxylesterase [Rehaibacterium terrae]